MSDLDTARLSRWLQQALPELGPVQDLEKFPGGQSNPTYRLTTAHGRSVLRRKPFGKLLPSAHAVEREYRVTSALHAHGFPVPRPLALCEDPQVIGAAFYVMEMVQGRSFWNGALPELPAAGRRACYESMIDTLAALHGLDHEALGLGDFGRPGNYFSRQVQRWTGQYRAAQTEDIPEVEQLIGWLPGTIPEQTRSTVIHGDYRIDNLIYSATGQRVAAVVDWELATIGDPLADFTYLAMNWVLPADERAALNGLDLPALGIPTLEQATARYCRATGRDGLPDLHWYFAYNLFRLVCILQGVKKRMLDGNASSGQASKMVQRIGPLARIAWSEAGRAGVAG
ncbi:MAG: phosphotransferase family protein [Proteobacteria bacterium]|nr:phosphotransferase family protein [Pseudomonadota bacterium]